MTNQVIAALIGASVGGLLALVGTAIAGIFERARVRQESIKRDEEWRREKCNTAYSEAVYYLFKLKTSSASRDSSDKDVRQHLSEAQRYLSLLQAYVPMPEIRSQLAVVSQQLTDSDDSNSLSARADTARRVVERSLMTLWGPAIRGEEIAH